MCLVQPSCRAVAVCLFGLCPPKLLVTAFLVEQLAMRSFLDNSSLMKDIDVISLLDGTQAMSDQNGGLACE